MNRRTLAVALLASMLAGPAYGYSCNVSPDAVNWRQQELARVHDSAASVRRTWAEIAKLATEVCRDHTRLNPKIEWPETVQLGLAYGMSTGADALARQYVERVINLVEKSLCRDTKCHAYDWAAEKALNVVSAVERGMVAKAEREKRIHAELNKRVLDIQAELKRPAAPKTSTISPR